MQESGGIEKLFLVWEI